MSDLSRTIHNPPTTDDARAIAASIAADATASALLPGGSGYSTPSAVTAAYAASPSEAEALAEALPGVVSIRRFDLHFAAGDAGDSVYTATMVLPANTFLMTAFASGYNTTFPDGGFNNFTIVDGNGGNIYIDSVGNDFEEKGFTGGDFRDLFQDEPFADKPYYPAGTTLTLSLTKDEPASEGDLTVRFICFIAIVVPTVTAAIVP